MKRALAAWMMIGWACMAQAMPGETPLPDGAQEAQAQTLFHDLKCVVCEGQSLAESHADFAAAMRADIRARLQAGDDAPTIRDYYRARYGDAILLTPPLKPSTAALWFAPLLLVIAGGALIWRKRKEPHA